MCRTLLGAGRIRQMPAVFTGGCALRYMCCFRLGGGGGGADGVSSSRTPVSSWGEQGGRGCA